MVDLCDIRNFPSKVFSYNVVTSNHNKYVHILCDWHSKMHWLEKNSSWSEKPKFRRRPLSTNHYEIIT